MMKLRTIERGQWTILAVCNDRGDCQMQDLLHQLEIDSQPDFDQMMALIRSTASKGPPKNPTKSRPLEGEILELKTRRGIRIPYFYDEGRVVICTEAMRKPKKTELRAVSVLPGQA